MKIMSGLGPGQTKPSQQMQTQTQPQADESYSHETTQKELRNMIVVDIFLDHPQKELLPAIV
jgi:hypothetical protein